MTDFNKIKTYYRNFNEKYRLINDNSGRLEYDMTINILKEYLPETGKILDLGGAVGVYTFPLAEIGYEMTLADLSEDLVNEARTIKEKGSYDNVTSCDVVNAIDLSLYEDNTFDVILMFGPFYHLLELEERTKCLNEAKRVLKPNGLIFISFIPYLSGSTAVIDRYIKHPSQVNVRNLEEVFKSGKFNNADIDGFQEGYYPRQEEIKELLEKHHFNMIDLLSIRGIGYQKEDEIYSIKDNEMLSTIMKLISVTAHEPAIIETCGHAIYIGKNIKEDKNV